MRRRTFLATLLAAPLVPKDALKVIVRPDRAPILLLKDNTEPVFVQRHPFYYWSSKDMSYSVKWHEDLNRFMEKRIDA